MCSQVETSLDVEICRREWGTSQLPTTYLLHGVKKEYHFSTKLFKCE